MHLATRARYALRMMVDVARHGAAGRPVSLGVVATHTAVSRGYLEHLASSLRNRGLLQGVAGRRGGYRLGRPAAEIRVDEIVSATLGPLSIVDCLGNPELCSKSGDCEGRLLWGLVNADLSAALHRHTLADLLDPAWTEATRRALEHELPRPAAAPNPNRRNACP
ncbi:MAG TPA: Rrf2 family transcriptional regulator [Vicinamibacteria bacterium]|nr:Rrf2 family transcriptional regulator [Vicinamibacteria bacterium]